MSFQNTARDIANIFEFQYKVPFGTSGTNALIPQVTNSTIAFGNGSTNLDVKFFGSSTSNYLLWDASANDLIFQDNVSVMFGTGNDIEVRWDGTDLDILQAAENSSIKLGVDGAGIDLVLYGDTASASLTWDQSADALILAGVARQYIGDSANAGMTIGLTINQAATDNEIIALKSSDVAHAATGSGGAEADTFGYFQKAEAAAGGLFICGLKDGDGVAGHAVHIRGVLDETAADTTKTTAGIGVVTIDGTLEGTNIPAVLGADENILVLRTLATTRHIFDAEGTYHGDEAATTFDEHDDIALSRAFDVTSPKKKGVIKNQWDQFAVDNEQKLIDLKILGAPRSEGGLVNFTRLVQLHNGCIWQLYSQLMELIAALPADVQAKLPAHVQAKLLPA